MQIIEKFVASRNGNPEECEDILFFNPYFAAAIDGATSRDNKLYDGKKSGLVAAMLVEETISKFHEPITLVEALEQLRKQFMRYYREHHVDYPRERLTASAVVYSAYHRQIWMLGDCRCRFRGATHENPNGIDEHIAAIRSFINQAELLKGKTTEWVAEHDPGAAYIHDLLTEQFMFQNHLPERTGAFGYTAVDGREMPEAAVKVIRLARDADELILASDGYPRLMDTLKETEEALFSVLRDDPLCIYSNQCVKGIKDGCISYDDRSYLRIRL